VVCTAYSAIPYWDYWGFVLPQNYAVGSLFAQHNEHRLAVPRLFFLADLVLCRGNNALLLTCGLLVQLLHAGLLVWILRSDSSVFRRVYRFDASIAATFLFSAQQFTNLVWGFQIQFFLVYFTATAALTCLSLSARAHYVAGDQRASWVWLWAGMILGIASTYSMANGILVWPLLVLLGMWLGLDRGRRTAVLVAAVLVVGSYLVGYRLPESSPRPLESLMRLNEVLLFAVAFVGSPADDLAGWLLGRFGKTYEAWRPYCSCCVGCVIVGAALVIAALLFRRRRLDIRSDPVNVCLMLFVLGSAGLTALGRLNLGLSEATSSRYRTSALVLWTCLGLAVVGLADSVRGRKSRGLGLLARFGVLGVAVGAVAVHQPARIAQGLTHKARLSAAETALVANVFDEDALRHAYPRPAEILPVADELRRRRMTVFAEEWTHWIGESLARHYRIGRGDNCIGNFDGIASVATPIRPGAAVWGWAWSPDTRSTPAVILLATEDQRIVGYARAGTFRPDVPAKVGAVRSAYTGWRGHVAGAEGKTVTAYAVGTGNSLCALSTARVAPSSQVRHFDSVPPAQVGSPLLDAPVTLGSWARDAYFRAVGPPPVETLAYGSWVWNSYDANAGSIRIGPFSVSGASALALPFVTGPKSEHLSIVVLDAATGRVLNGLSPVPPTPSWKIWKIPLPPGKAHLRLEIVAADSGTGWGEWLAIGLPLELR
jgi:hypothetical protein